MRNTSTMILAATICATSASATPAFAAEVPRSINQPPSGPGSAEERTSPQGSVVQEGVEASVGLGTGFADTYGLGLEGRAGYTWREGVYAGGAVQYFIGHSVNDQQAHATFVGGEIGYKIYPDRRVEIRPYAFVGPAWITQVASVPFETLSKVDLAVQPGVLAEYHFGAAYVGGDAHYMLLPSPNTLAVLATAGVGF